MIKGNIIDKNCNYFSTEVLYNMYKKSVGNKFDNTNETICEVTFDKEKDWVYLYTIKN
jgi:hypothetical protein